MSNLVDQKSIENITDKIFEDIIEPLFKEALEYYAPKLIEYEGWYSKHHINEICEKHTPVFDDAPKKFIHSYDAYKAIAASNTKLAEQIKDMTHANAQLPESNKPIESLQKTKGREIIKYYTGGYCIIN